MKGANLLIDSTGVLKIADFGLATFYDPGSQQPMTSRVATLWYRPPELLLGATRYSAAVDMWSTGCIFAELLTGKPIMPGRTEVQETVELFELRRWYTVIWLTTNSMLGGANSQDFQALRITF
jgi:serine/threonine protein kinase